MTSGNIFGAPLRETTELFSNFIQGIPGGYTLYLSQHQPTDLARTAINNSLSALGYDKNSCCFVALSDNDTTLDHEAVRVLIEGLDPVLLIVGDTLACNTIAQAYRCAITLDSPLRVMGRSGVAFSDFEGMLATPSDKQRAWALLKTLPKKN